MAKKKTKAAPKSKAKQKAQQLLTKFTKKGPGNKVTKKEVKKIVKKTSVSPAKIKKAANTVNKISRKKDKITLAGKAQDYLNNILKGPKIGDDKKGDDTVGGTSSVWQDEGTGVFGPISQHEKDIENIRADAERYIADARANADRYIADAEVRGIDISSGRQLEGAKYVADKESQWRQAVANIEVKGRLDLQPIINAGLEKVAGIEAQAQRDVADITGKYDVEGIRVRGEADKQIGGMQLAGNMYNLINAAFG
jgi:hypothetical protein